MITKFQEIKNESKLLKDWYGLEFAELFVNHFKIKQKNDFLTQYKKNYKNLELKGRITLIADLMNEHVGFSYPAALKNLTKLIGPEYPHETGMMNNGFHLYPVSQFVENNALEDVSSSLDFIYELTKRFTGEFAIRPIAREDKKTVLKISKEWSKDKNFHVRRLASEGLRVRLPWGQGVEWLKKEPELTFPVLEKLKNDPVLYVRRSVANAMGDIIKINEGLGYEVLSSWIQDKPSAETLWVVSHAIRHPVKKNNKKFVKLREKVSTLRK